MRPQESAAPRVVGVARLVNYLRSVLTNDKWLRNIGVRGEISNLSPPRRGGGNLYFDLKDADVVLACIVWSESVTDLPPLENGQQVVAYGEISTHPKASKYQLIARRVEPEGIGRLQEMFERLKRKLEAEGAFATARKRAIPQYPFALALVSSHGAAGAADFLKILRARAPQVAVQFVETPVQGVTAATEIARAINRASRLEVDAIVVARGGGSYEDLFAFNTEEVARAILRAGPPVISAVGHESDFTIADMVADRRAETPSAAAHVVARATRDELLRAIATRTARIERLTAAAMGQRRQTVEHASTALAARIGEGRRRRFERLAALERRLFACDPGVRLAERGKQVALASVRLEGALDRTLRAARERLGLLLTELAGKDPETILQRGYAIVRFAGRAVRDAAVVPDGAQLRAQVAHGTLVVRVERKETDAE
ncbi:MAG: exodeoxyribonuclease VII large subunit [Candidatus Eremiobacteraeota bacterium]|nr:exodeoxyribonuclease VII large subunit [Candidatus Eremiobacteraeota bacterium]